MGGKMKVVVGATLISLLCSLSLAETPEEKVKRQKEALEWIQTKQDLPASSNTGRSTHETSLDAYVGNEIVKIAIKDNVGDDSVWGINGYYGRQIHVSVKNYSNKPIHINPNYFTVIDSLNRSVSYERCSDRFMVDLQPGTETWGTLGFPISKTDKPKQLIFQHPFAGRIVRDLQ